MSAYNKIRERLTEHLAPFKSEFPTVPLVTDNTALPNFDEIPVFVHFSISYTDRLSATISVDCPLTLGNALFEISYKTGTGTANVLKMFDYLSELFEFKNIHGITTDAALLDSPKDVYKGYVSRTLVVDFQLYGTPD